MGNLFGLILFSQICMACVYGIFWIGIRNERIKTERMLKEAIRALRIIGVSKGYHL